MLISYNKLFHKSSILTDGKKKRDPKIVNVEYNYNYNGPHDTSESTP